MESIAIGRRKAKEKTFNPKPFAARLDQLMGERNISMRQTGIESGLDHESIRRIKAGDRPDMTYCILLADYFDVNPNEFFTSTRGKERMAFMRQVYTYCLWLFTDMNQKQISVCIYRERSNVSTTIRMIKKRCSVEEDFKNEIIQIEEMFE